MTSSIACADNARYCLVRLVLRKPDQWHALSSLESYKKEVGEVGLVRAITDLCRPWYEIMNGTGEELDVNADSGMRSEVKELIIGPDEDIKISISQSYDEEAGPSNTSARSSSTLSDSDFPILSQENLEEVRLDSFCHDESIMDITDLLNRLSVKQLKELVKATKSRPNRSNKLEMIRALLANAATQSVLDFPVSPANKKLRQAPEPSMRQITFDVKLSPKGKEKAMPRNQERRLVQMALKILGKCVRINEDFYHLVQRLHLICFRCTEQPTSLLLPALLTSFKKRTYPKYKYNRDNSIWPTREDLLAYEEALELEAHLEKVMNKLPEKNAPLAELVAPATPIGQILRTPKARFKAPKDPPTFGSGVKEEVVDPVEDAFALPEVTHVEEEEANIRKARRVKELLHEKIYPNWKVFIDAKTREGWSSRKPGLERFDPGYVYTRMLHHALRALATLKEYQSEYDILQDLLGQTFYRRGSRAKWYERRAIIQTMYLCKVDGRQRDEDVLRQAMDGVKEALVDEDTGIVWRPGLFRRLQRLEKMLHIPEEERSQCEGELKQPQKVFVRAARSIKRSDSMPIDRGSQSANSKSGGLHGYLTPKKNEEELKEEDVVKEEEEVHGKSKIQSWKGKSLWVGRDNDEVYVEIRALQHYETLGFRGFHAETRILTTIFSLLFWDIIFADVPGAFETPYQTAPLDLAEDTFYYARKDMIEARLEEIRDGNARKILLRHDDQHREKQTMCVGLRWDMCESADLVEIVDCLGGPTLALICRLFCEDYNGRCSGVPDLVVWKAQQRMCKFVEVKGPGDRPQENQKLWFDSLLRAGANVEICHVIDINAPPKEKRKTPGTGTNRKRKALPIQPEQQECANDDDDDREFDRWDCTPTPISLNSAPRKKRRKKRHADDELPSYIPGILDEVQSPLAMDRPNAPRAAFCADDTPSKRKK
ncbi:hypothetical protein APHAL10511_000915 [Amanita phalloides]|nr:hypothetical protein APHAL10511_000915 [Amanita phalloides]